MNWNAVCYQYTNFIYSCSWCMWNDSIKLKSASQVDKCQLDTKHINTQLKLAINLLGYWRLARDGSEVVLGISYWSEYIICCRKSFVLILAYKEDEDKLPAASLPYAILVIIFKSKIFCRESYCFSKRKVEQS